MSTEAEVPKVTAEEGGKGKEEKVVGEEGKTTVTVEGAEDGKKEDGDGGKGKEPVPPPPRVHKQDFEKDTVYLYQFSRTPLLPSLSPFCLKVETWLRLTGLKYEVGNPKIKLYFSNN
jgi:hypothetical protein